MEFLIKFDDHELRLVPVNDYSVISFSDDLDAAAASEIAEGESWSDLAEFYAALQAEGIKFEVK